MRPDARSVAHPSRGPRRGVSKKDRGEQLVLPVSPIARPPRRVRPSTAPAHPGADEAATVPRRRLFVRAEYDGGGARGRRLINSESKGANGKEKTTTKDLALLQPAALLPAPWPSHPAARETCRLGRLARSRPFRARDGGGSGAMSGGMRAAAAKKRAGAGRGAAATRRFEASCRPPPHGEKTGALVLSRQRCASPQAPASIKPTSAHTSLPHTYHTDSLPLAKTPN